MSSRENTGMALGLLGVIIFSLTLPFTRIVVQEIHPLLNGLGRALFAAVPAAALLLWRRERWPTWRQVRGLCLVIAGVILGFPVLSAWAMQTLPASHGALVNGLQPLCVALYAAWLSHERPSKAFWACAALGSALVLSYALITGASITLQGVIAGDAVLVADDIIFGPEAKVAGALTIALRNPELIASRMAGAMLVLSKVSLPLVWLLE